MTDQTEFDKQLQALFPEIYKLNLYGGLDPKLWLAIYAIYEFYEARMYGEVIITFQDGKINRVRKTINLESPPNKGQ